MKIIRTDCLVIGAGLAGCAYALHAAQRGLQVELLSLDGPLVANSDWAQGGIIYSVASTPEKFARDIMEASDHEANPKAIAHLVKEGPVAVKETLIDLLGVAFDLRHQIFEQIGVAVDIADGVDDRVVARHANLNVTGASNAPVQAPDRPVAWCWGTVLRKPRATRRGISLDI